MIISPGPVHGTVAAPPSKSVTHRLLVLGAHTERTTIRNALIAKDTTATMECLGLLGARLEIGDDITLGQGPHRVPAAALPCGNSGTTLRLMAAQAALRPAAVWLDGDTSLRQRPMAELLAALGGLGCRTEASRGRAPLCVQGPIRSGRVDLGQAKSSQFASALLLALGTLPVTSAVRPPHGSRPYVDLTVQAMRGFGLHVAEEDGWLHVGGETARGGTFHVEGDWSAAALLWASGVGGGAVTVQGLDLGSCQGDRVFLDHARAFGCDVRSVRDGATVRCGDLRSPGVIDLAATPDLGPPLAVLAAVAKGTTTFTGATALRAKESDRIAAIIDLLGHAGIRAEPTPTGFVVAGGTVRAGKYPSAGDHRIHMAAAALAKAADGPCDIGPDTAGVSYPNFHRDLALLEAP